jgi:hypothetical protein
MVAAELIVLRHMVDDDRPAAIANFVAIVVLTSSSPPGSSPKAISSRTAQATQRSLVSRATAANPIPVVRQITSRMDATASICETADISPKESCEMGATP